MASSSGVMEQVIYAFSRKLNCLSACGSSVSFRGIKDLDPNDTASIVVIDNDAIRDFSAVLDGPVGQIEIDRIRRTIDSHAHGLVFFPSWPGIAV